jgi:hypothetical protein
MITRNVGRVTYSVRPDAGLQEATRYLFQASKHQKHPRFGWTPVIIFCMSIATCHRTYVAGNRAAGQQFVEHSCTAAEAQ